MINKQKNTEYRIEVSRDQRKIRNLKFLYLDLIKTYRQNVLTVIAKIERGECRMKDVAIPFRCFARSVINDNQKNALAFDHEPQPTPSPENELMRICLVKNNPLP